MFQIDKPTPAILKAKTTRDERHGDDKVPALSLRWRLRVPNTWLDLLSPGLCEVFYERGDDDQMVLPGTAVVALTKLRTRALGNLEVKNAYENCTLAVTISDKSLVFGGSKIDKFCVPEMHDGGTVEIEFRMGTSDIDARSAGRLVMMTVDSEHYITLTVPVQEEDEGKPAQASIDMSKLASHPLESVERVVVTPIAALAKADKAARKAAGKVTHERVVAAAAVNDFTQPGIDAAVQREIDRADGITKPKKVRTMAQKIARAEKDAQRAGARP